MAHAASVRQKKRWVIFLVISFGILLGVISSAVRRRRTPIQHNADGNIEVNAAVAIIADKGSSTMPMQGLEDGNSPSFSGSTIPDIIASTFSAPALGFTIPGTEEEEPPPVKQAPLLEKGNSEGLCRAMNFEGLQEAAVDISCTVIILPRREYNITEEVVINRRVTITGLDPLRLPQVHCRASRCFRVAAGGYLSMRYITTTQGEGVYVSRLGPLVEPTPFNRVSQRVW